jgi:hypothetical protein
MTLAAAARPGRGATFPTLVVVTSLAGLFANSSHLSVASAL